MEPLGREATPFGECNSPNGPANVNVCSRKMPEVAYMPPLPIEQAVLRNFVGGLSLCAAARRDFFNGIDKLHISVIF